MTLLKPLDAKFPIERQLDVEVSPVVLVNIFTLNKADEAEFLKVWEDDAAFMKAKLSAYPASSVATPHLFQKVAVPGICVAG